MPLEQTKFTKLKKLVARNELRQAIADLVIISEESGSQEFVNGMIMLSGQFYNHNSSVRKGVITMEAEVVGKARLRAAILSYIEDFKEVIDEVCNEGNLDIEEVNETLNNHLVLFFGANPPRTTRIEITQEAAIIQEELDRCTLRDKIVLEQRWDITPASMLQALLNNKPTILHFSGHGEPEEGRLILYKNSIEAHEVSHKAFVELLSMQKSLKCVVLNCCFSDVLADEIIAGTNLDCVIGMNNEIPDNAAIAFSKGFYKSIGSGQSYENAFHLGRNLIGLEGIEGIEVPVIKLRKMSKKFI